MEKNNGHNYIKLSTRKHFLFLKVMVITHYQLPQESLDSRAHTSFCRPTKSKSGSHRSKTLSYWPGLYSFQSQPPPYRPQHLCPAAALTGRLYTIFAAGYKHYTYSLHTSICYHPLTCIPIAMLCTLICMYLHKPHNRNNSLEWPYFAGCLKKDPAIDIQLPENKNSHIPCAWGMNRKKKSWISDVGNDFNSGFLLFSYSQTKLERNMTAEPNWLHCTSASLVGAPSYAVAAFLSKLRDQRYF